MVRQNEAPNWLTIKTLSLVVTHCRDNKLLEGKGRFVNRKTKTANKDYDKFYIYIPAGVVKDSSFPFKPDEAVNIKINKKRLLIEKIKP